MVRKFGIFDTFADEVVREAHLNEERNGNCRLMASTLSETVPMWRTAVASYAEWIAKSFWDSRIRPIRSEAPATRLAQRQRSDGRAKLLGVDETTSSKLALCRICGQVRLGSNGICRGCADPARFVQLNSQDGTRLRKVIESPIAALEGISPGGQWLVVRLPGAKGASTTAFPLHGGSPVDIVAPGAGADHALKWSPDGRWVFSVVLERNLVYGETYAFPLPHGRLLPQPPPGVCPWRLGHIRILS